MRNGASQISGSNHSLKLPLAIFTSIPGHIFNELIDVIAGNILAQ